MAPRRSPSLLLAAALLCATASHSYPALDSFEGWLVAEGGRIASSAAFATRRTACSAGARPSLGVVSTARVPRETVIVGVPHGLLLWPVDDAKCASCDAYEKLALRLLEVRAEGRDSKWAPYIQLLPEEVPSSLSFTRAEMAELRGTYAGTVAAVARQRAARFLTKAKREQPGLWTDEALRWALSIVLSRSFTVGAPSHVAASSVSVNASGGGGGGVAYHTPFLAPGADLLNHGPTAKVGWTFRAKPAPAPRGARNTIEEASGAPPASAEYFGVVSLSTLPLPGAEVMNSYEEHATNAHTLAYYGFAVEENPWDAVVLSLPLLPPGAEARSSSTDLLSVSLGHARADLGVRLRALADAGKALPAHVDLALALLPAVHGSPVGDAAGGWSAASIPNVTVVLHSPGHGGPPSFMLNAAKIAALGLPATQQWLDLHARSHGARTLAVRDLAALAAARTASVAATAAAAAAPPSAPPTPRPAYRQSRAGGTPPTPAPASSSPAIPLRHEVLVPASGEEEVATVSASLRDAALTRVAQALGQLLADEDHAVPAQVRALVSADTHGGASGRPPAAPPSHEAYAVDPSSGRVMDLRQVGRTLTDDVAQGRAAGGVVTAHALSASFNAPALLSSSLNSSALLDLLAHRVLLSSLRRLANGYPASVRQDEEELGAVRSRVEDVEVACGLRRGSARRRGRPASAAAAAAAGLHNAPRAPALSPEQALDADVELKALQTRLAVLITRIGEQRILLDAIVRISEQASVVAAKLRANGVHPVLVRDTAAGGGGSSGGGKRLTPSTARTSTPGWEEEWSLDLPDIDGYFSVPLPEVGAASSPVDGLAGSGAEEGGASVPMGGVWYHGGHVHEEEEGWEEEEEGAAGTAGASVEGRAVAESEGGGGEGGSAAVTARPQSHLRKGHGHADEHAGAGVDDGHVARHVEHVHVDDGVVDTVGGGEEPVLGLDRKAEAAEATPANASPTVTEQEWTPHLRAGTAETAGGLEP